MQNYEAPMACAIAFEIVNVIAASAEDTPENLVRWGSLVEEVNSARNIPM